MGPFGLFKSMKKDYGERCQQEMSLKKCDNKPTFGLECKQPLVCLSYQKTSKMDAVHKTCRNKIYDKIPKFGLEGKS